MNKILFIALVILSSCNATKPVISGDKLIEGKDTLLIQKSASGRSYVIKDGKRINLYRTKETVKL